MRAQADNNYTAVYRARSNTNIIIITVVHDISRVRRRVVSRRYYGCEPTAAEVNVIRVRMYEK
jgi:hypothetical protein